MDKDLLVQILVGQDQKLVGTGYPIAKNRILTARHLFDAQSSPIWIRWRIGSTEAPQSAKLIWSSAAPLDAAVLDTVFPDALVGKSLPRLSSRKPETGWKWESEGYGRAGDQPNGTVKPIAMSGETHSAATDDPTFSLGVQYQTTLSGGWKGVSGGPVFYQGAIIGIVVDCPGYHANSRLGAVPTWKLLTQKSFCDAALFDGGADQLIALRKKVFGKIKNLPDFQFALKELSCVDGESSKEISESLLQKSADDFLQSIRIICANWDEDGWPANVQKSEICEIVFLSLPIVFGQDIVENIRHRHKGNNPGGISGATTLAGAEIAMARHDGRRVMFGKSENSEELPLALYAVPSPPAVGIDSDENRKSTDDIVHLEQFLVSKFANHGPGWDENERRSAVNKVLESRSKIKQSWYYPFWNGSISGSRDVFLFIEQIAKKFNYLYPIPLGGDFHQKLLESTIPDLLIYFVSLANCEPK